MVADVVKRIVYRNNFQSALLAYVKAHGQALYSDPALQQGFIRRVDSLCN